MVKILRLALLACGALALALWLRAMTDMPLRSHAGALPPLGAEERLVARGLADHVQTLAGDIGERNLGRPGSLSRAADYIDGVFSSLGYRVGRQDFLVEGERVFNLEAEIPGSSRSGEIIVVGAHYDSVTGSPGANDNASGAAALMELGRLLAGLHPSRTIRLVAFVNEEPPYFQGPLMGSLLYARRCRQRGEKIVGMLSLETVGCYFDEPGSQSYPPPFGLFYPDKGNFIAFVGNLSSGRLLRRSLEAFRRFASFPSEGISAPAAVMGVGWSDHWAFWQQGYRAIMVTDTALFRYPHYHSAEDTPGRIDYDRTARVTAGLVPVVLSLAGGGGSGP